MARDDAQLNSSKRAYRDAKAEGNRQEEARWANVIGNILKTRGEYVEALKWFRIDYEVSVKYLPEKHLLPTCQSLGEVYLRLEYFKDALIYQKKHLELAKEADDLVEQQRASTQLGRTYHEMFLRSEDDHYLVRNAKKYFRSSMKLAKNLKENSQKHKGSFLKEYIDAHNNIGMLEMDLDNLEEAQKILTKGLEICDEEEVIEFDDCRSRLHHNLGNVYMELRIWNEALKHIEKDILICRKIGHCQGEAKGYINLGELHYRVQKYDEALHCYKKALDLAKAMEDEDALARQIDDNIRTVKAAAEVMGELKKEEQNLKKLTREKAFARGTPHERKCLLQQNASLDCLIEKSRQIFLWTKHLEFSKRKKRIADELCDKEKLSDSYLVIGESYEKLRKFEKAIKWYCKSWEEYLSIGNLEGQALAKINIGNVLDCSGKWTEALDAFEESYRIAVDADLPSVQISALESMHYSHMIRFDNTEEARRLQLLIDKLKLSEKSDREIQNTAEDRCSETDTEVDEHCSDSVSSACCLPSLSLSKRCLRKPVSSKSLGNKDEQNDDTNMQKLSRSSLETGTVSLGEGTIRKTSSGAVPGSLCIPDGNRQRVVGHKRVILSDSEDETLDDLQFSKRRSRKRLGESFSPSDELKSNDLGNLAHGVNDASAEVHEFPMRSSYSVEGSSSSYKSSPHIETPNEKAFRFSSNDVISPSDAASGSKCEGDCSENRLHTRNAAYLKFHPSVGDHDQCITFKMGNDLMHVQLHSTDCEYMSIESFKDELACFYYLQLPIERRSEGLLPVIQHVRHDGRILETLETIETHKERKENAFFEALIDGWVSKPLIKLYVDYCKELSEAPNMKLLKKLYNLEASDDDVAVSECDLQDLSITPLLSALHAHKTFAVLDLSHNMLGNGTLEKIQRVFTMSGQTNDLTLDLHCNRFGPTALFQICECPALFTRLEVLNISGNRLTDACGSYLSTILQNCKGLWSLSIERCSITSRTIQKIADTLIIESPLEQLSIGYNSPVTGNAIINLIVKLTTLKRLSLNGLKLSKPAIDSLCQLVRTSCLSGLMLGGTGMGTDAALQIMESFSASQESVKLDLSYCALASRFLLQFSDGNISIQCVQDLSLTGNPLMHEGCTIIASLITSPSCCLRVLALNKCQLGLPGILQIIQALAGNCCLEELNLADNGDLDKHFSKSDTNTAEGRTELRQPSLGVSELSLPVLPSGEGNTADLRYMNNGDGERLLREDATTGPDSNCMNLSETSASSLKCQFMQELSNAVSMAKALQLLDLSNNGFSGEAAETLYVAWSNSRSSLAKRHIQDHTVHLFVEGIKCCVRPCCRKL